MCSKSAFVGRAGGELSRQYRTASRVCRAMRNGPPPLDQRDQPSAEKFGLVLASHLHLGHHLTHCPRRRSGEGSRRAVLARPFPTVSQLLRRGRGTSLPGTMVLLQAGDGGVLVNRCEGRVVLSAHVDHGNRQCHSHLLAGSLSAFEGRSIAPTTGSSEGTGRSPALRLPQQGIGTSGQYNPGRQ
ncbi:hypothetical protein H696_01018, partial [Fonticula alba]